MKLAGKNVLVTGGAGFIGSHLVDSLINSKPAKLIVVDNYFLGNAENLANAYDAYSDLKEYRLDASNLAAMRRVIETEQIEVVFDLAVIPLPTSLDYPVWTIETNIGIATTLAELARWECYETLIHCSSSEAYGSAQYVPMDENHPQAAITPYAASKAAADQIVLGYWRTYGISAVIVRPFNAFGPRQNPGSYAGVIPKVIQRVLDNLPVEIHGDGSQTRDFIFVREAADAFIQAAECEQTRGRVINVATGQETSINQLVAKLLRVMDREDHPIVHTDPRAGDVMRHCGDIGLAQELFGFKSAAITDDYLAETVDWYLRRA